MSFTEKSIVCSDCGATLLSALKSRNSSSQKATPMNQSVAYLPSGRKQERFGNSGGLAAEDARCSRLFVQNAERNRSSVRTARRQAGLLQRLLQKEQSPIVS